MQLRSPGVREIDGAKTLKRTGWLEVTEAGGALGIQLLVLACTLFGRAPVRFCLRPLARYYWLTHRIARRASREWLGRIHGPERVTSRMVYEHMLRFAQVALDRLFLVRGQSWRFDFKIEGDENFRPLRRAKRGVIFLGAHLGSFEALNALADFEGAAVNIVGYFRNARMINAALSRLDPGAKARVIEIRPGSVDFIFTIQERINRGEHVALLGDRVGLGEMRTEAEFMGSVAPFPAGPFLLAALLRCPIYLVFALHREPNRYDVHCEKFAERIVLPRNARAEAAAEYARQFAGRLEHYARLAPDNWFNFFDFWPEPPASDAAQDQ